jgi:hypothetical protein
MRHMTARNNDPVKHTFWRGTGPTDLPRAGPAASLHPITVPLAVPDGAGVAAGK